MLVGLLQVINTVGQDAANGFFVLVVDFIYFSSQVELFRDIKHQCVIFFYTSALGKFFKVKRKYSKDKFPWSCRIIVIFCNSLDVTVDFRKMFIDSAYLSAVYAMTIFRVSGGVVVFH